MAISDFVTVEWAPASDPTDTTPTWVDITSIVQEVTVTGGRSGVFDLYGPRTCTVVCKNGTRSPVLAPTFDVQGFYRWRQLRVVYATSAIAIFTGYILTVEHDQTDSPYVGWATISAADAMVVLAQAEFTPSDNSTVSSLSLGDSVSGSVSVAGLDTSLITTQGPSTAFYTLDAEPTGQILSWLQGVMEAEAGGPLQISAAGQVYTNGRNWVFDVFNPGAQLTLSDTPTGGEHKYLREHLTFASTDTDYYNRAVTKSAYHDNVWTVEDVPSGYPKETLSRTSLPFTADSWAEANASLYANLYSTPVTYPRSVVIFGSSAQAEQAVLQNLCVSTAAFGAYLVVVKHTPVGDTQQTYNVSIESVTHTITPELWKAELGFASLDRWLTAYGNGSAISTLFYVGSSTVGGTDILAP